MECSRYAATDAAHTEYLKNDKASRTRKRNLVNPPGFLAIPHATAPPLPGSPIVAAGKRVEARDVEPPKRMTRGLGGPRVKRDWRVREAEGGFCAPVDRRTRVTIEGSGGARGKNAGRWLGKSYLRAAAARAKLQSSLIKLTC